MYQRIAAENAVCFYGPKVLRMPKKRLRRKGKAFVGGVGREGWMDVKHKSLWWFVMHMYIYTYDILYSLLWRIFLTVYKWYTQHMWMIVYVYNMFINAYKCTFSYVPLIFKLEYVIIWCEFVVGM